MNLNHLQHFLAIAENGGVRAAADALGISQPAISKSLRVLEQDLGVPLVQRGARGSTLTTFGHVLYARAKVIGNEMERVTGELRQLAGMTDGQVALGASATASMILLPIALPRFQKLNPRVQFDIMGGLPVLLLPRLVDGSLDLLVGPRPTQELPRHITATKLFTISSMITVRKNHPLQQAKHLADFAEAQWVVNSSAGHANSALHSAFAAIGVKRFHTVLHADSLYAAYAMIAKTDYVGLLPSALFNDSIARDVLSVIEVPEFSAFDSIELFSRSNSPLSAAATMLADTLEREAYRIRQRDQSRLALMPISAAFG